ncbi:MAG: HXXEE domain-containing protein [bacterium]
MEIKILNKRIPANLGIAWLALCLSLAVHVIDETLTGFLSVYNPIVLSIRKQWPFIRLPTFTLEVWLVGLIIAFFVLLSLSPFAFRRAKWIGPLCYVFGIVMLFNGLLHIAGSFYLGESMPGLYSSPLLLVSSLYLLVTTKYSTNSDVTGVN